MLPKILLWPNKILEQPSEPVTMFDDELVKLSQDMIEICKRTQAWGLAAIQIGIPKQMFVLRDDKGDFGTYINPSWYFETAAKYDMPEGCLSYPGQEIVSNRYGSIVAAWTDLTGSAHSATLHGVEAQVFQHELEHCSGETLIDQLTDPKQRGKLRSEAIRIKRSGFKYRY